jgi:glycolate oxidase FAD binding subunit
MAVYFPETADDVRAVIADAVNAGRKLDIQGGGSKGRMGAPHRQADILKLSRMSGILDHDPAELVLTVKAGTPLSVVEEQLSAHGQYLAFDPFDHGPIFGESPGAATIGGIVAAAVSGSGRVSGGAVRDHVLGFQAVSGRAEIFKGGAKVVKNVTGYDLPKLLTGSWGRLAALTEITLKVLPKPHVELSLVKHGLSTLASQQEMARAMGAQVSVAAAAYVPASPESAASRTVFRLHGFEPSVRARALQLKKMLGELEEMQDADATAFWQQVRTVSLLDARMPQWRVHIPPSSLAQLVAALEPLEANWFADWAGGLVWMSFAGEAHQIRDAAARAGGQATLVRASDELRSSVPLFQPELPGVAALSARVRRMFDPSSVFETGRFLDMSHAD